MTSRPIIFSAPMVRAILAGAKTQTRRIVGGAALARLESGCHDGTPEFVALPKYRLCPYGVAGDELWVRETVCIMGAIVIYAADWSGAELRESALMRRRYPELAAAYPDSRWRPSIYMPRWAARITLSVTDVRAERLMDISDADAIAEGVVYSPPSPRAAFAELWNSINAKRAPWSSNPWVWVVSFTKKESSS